MGAFRDVKQVVRAQIPESATTVLLGECTHGTEEFYRHRAEISKYLIEVRKFKVVIVEADWPFMWHVNQYIHRKKVNMFPDNVRFPDWMWRNQPFAELVEWMRQMSQTDNACYLFGMDCYCKEESRADLLRWLDNHDPALSKELRQTCFPRERPDKWPEILSKIQWGRSGGGGGRKNSTKSSTGASSPQVISGSNLTRDEVYPGSSKLDRFNAEQNLECMIAADEYYTKQRLEPPGSQASWNARDQHMATTILRLKHQGRDTFQLPKGEAELKIIVWAHNSHVGDSTATPSGGVDFERNETWNLGQMCKSVLENVFVVGFYSFCGEVRAAKEWGRPGQVMQLQPAFDNSLEHQLHTLFPKKSAFVALDAKAKNWYRAPPEFALPCEYECVYPGVRATENSSSKSKLVFGDTGTASPAARRPPLKSFTAVERVGDPRSQVWRLRANNCRGKESFRWNDECWVDEYTANRSVSVHALPAEVLQRLRADPLRWLNCAPVMQRWVGVQYHPETELQSHYGEMLASQAYNLLIFVDETTALDVDLKPTKSKFVDADGGSGGAEEVSAAAQKRLMREYAKLLKDPPQGVEAHPLEDNILEWHFRLTGNQPPYTGGRYHGVLEFPKAFPMQPPSIRMLTPSGRFEINKRICLSMSDFHAESWNPAWTVEKILVGLMSFMYEESTESIGSLLDAFETRQRYAKESEFFNRENEIYTQLFPATSTTSSSSGGPVVAEMNSSSSTSEAGRANNKRPRRTSSADVVAGAAATPKMSPAEDHEENDGIACRFCLGNEGSLVAPCECRGTNQYVHLACLRQWQKSVMLTQSTHPKFQTRIDAICNICERPFKDKFRPRDRKEAVLEFAGPEMARRLKKGNLLVSSERESRESTEAMEKNPELRIHLEHWTYAVYLIANDVAVPNPGESSSSNSRDGGVLAVNLVQKLPNGPPAKVSNSLPGYRTRQTSPLNTWNRLYKSRVDSLRSVAQVEHFIGGPVEPDDCLALVFLPKLDARFRQKANHVRNGMFFGNLQTIADLAEMAHASNKDNRTKLYIFWGYAAWNTSQLFAEIAKRHWGLGVEEYDFDPLPTWDDVVMDVSMAKESEYSKN